MSGNGRASSMLNKNDSTYSSTDPMNDGNPDLSRRHTLQAAGRGAGRGGGLRTSMQPARKKTAAPGSPEGEDSTMTDNTRREITPQTGTKRSLDLNTIGIRTILEETSEQAGEEEDIIEDQGGTEEIGQDDVEDGEIRETGHKKNEFRTAANVLNNSNQATGGDNILPLGPKADEQVAPSIKMYQYNVELTFTKPLRTGGNSGIEFNVTHCLKEVVKKLRGICSCFALLPYNTTGNAITHEEQIPKNDLETCLIYYYNHRIHPRNGSLIGMISFTMAATWSEIKDDRKIFFRWMSALQIYMKQISFKASTISSAGFLYNAHPDVTRRDDAMKELNERVFTILGEAIDFQVVPRGLHVAHKKDSKSRFSFRALAVECDGKDVTRLREALYQLGDPEIERKTHLVTGHLLFVPFMASEAWSHENILGMAKAHQQQISQLQQIFVKGSKDIDESLVANNGKKATLRDVIARVTLESGRELFHSIHKTSIDDTFTALFHKKNAKEAEEYFEFIHERLQDLPEEVHANIFVANRRVEMTGRARADSRPAKQSANLAANIIYNMNPQDGEEMEETPRPIKRRVISYSDAATPRKRKDKVNSQHKNKSDNESEASDDEAPYELQDESEHEPVKQGRMRNLQQKLAELTNKFNEQYGDCKPISVDTAEAMMRTHSENQAAESEKRLEDKLKAMTLGLRSEMNTTSNALRQEITDSSSMLLTEFSKLLERQNTFIKNTNNQVQDKLLKLHENIMSISKGAGIMHQEQPLIVAAAGTKILWSVDGTT